MAFIPSRAHRLLIDKHKMELDDAGNNCSNRPNTLLQNFFGCRFGLRDLYWPLNMSLDLSKAAWLYPLRVCSPYSFFAPLTPIDLGNLLFLIESLSLAAFQDSSHTYHTALCIHIHDPLPLRIPSASCLPRYIPRCRSMGQRCVLSPGRRGRDRCRSVRGFLRRRDPRGHI